GNQSVVVILPPSELNQTFVGSAHGANLGTTGTAKVANIRVIGAFLVSDAVDKLGNKRVQIRIALAVAVGTHIEGHAIDKGGKVSAVIQIKTAQKILVGLAGTAVLGDHHTGHHLQDF